MAHHDAWIEWSHAGGGFGYEEYSRSHSWRFDNGTVVEATASPQFRGDPARVDPEEAFVAALSSCHMLTFLAIAARAGLPVSSYRDHATGRLAPADDGKLSMVEVILRPEVVFGVDVSSERLRSLHDASHRECFLARSVRTPVRVEPVPGTPGPE